MLKRRIIPCLDIRDGRTVKGVNFVNLRDAGDAVELAKMYVEQGADELVFLDITASHEKRKILLNLVEEVAKSIRIPFTVGGGISELEDIESLLKAGADKVSLNSSIVKNPGLISSASKRFGSQAIVAAIDVKQKSDTYKVFIKGGREETELEGFDWCKKVQELGAGEILLTSMDKDGTKQGYDIPFLSRLTKELTIPVIASGGAGSKEHFLEAFRDSGVEACLAASLFHFSILDINDLKKYLYDNNIKVRINL